MTRKAVARRLGLMVKTKTVIRSLSTRIARGLAERPAAPGGAGVSYQIVLAHLDAEIVDAERQLAGAEEAYSAAKARFEELKGERDDARSSLGRAQRRIRQFLRGFFQPDALARAGIDRPVAPSAPELLSQVARTTSVLRDLETLGPPILEMIFNAPAVADRLESDLGRLEAAVAGLEAARAGVVVTRACADRAVVETDRVAPWIGRCVESLCHLAGEHG